MAKGKENAIVQLVVDPDPGLLRIIDKQDALYSGQITVDFPEFTSLCPVTWQPDCARMLVHYVPAKKCLNEESVRRYLGSFRNHGGFNEVIVNRILDDLVNACAPEEMKVRGEFASRGGIQLTVEVCHPA